MVTYSTRHHETSGTKSATQSGEPAGSSRENTREKVLHAVLTSGPVSAASIGSELHLTAAAVRRHLDALESEGLIEVKSVSGDAGAGRPSKRYVVTHKGQQQLGDDYLAVTSAAMEMIAELGGPEAVRRFARDHFAEVETLFLDRATDEMTLSERIKVLTAVLDELGYAATTRRAGRGARVTTLRAAQICQGHCPIKDLAAQYPEFCEEETELFARLLQVDVRRLATLPTGGHVCTTHVPLGRKAYASLTAQAEQNAARA
ncbi:helix-turn-helix transcriptional regulator [Auritidibacter ignavus]|uniref:helix-turn-helix transcriptional regulator n=1 Tax=Auritidibacter ignavus TaxID=678932 RepID=UPI0015D604BD|nr:HTH domain-containing protein [Auritidibacter ignavus]